MPGASGVILVIGPKLLPLQRCLWECRVSQAREGFSPVRSHAVAAIEQTLTPAGSEEFSPQCRWNIKGWGAAAEDGSQARSGFPRQR